MTDKDTDPQDNDTAHKSDSDLQKDDRTETPEAADATLSLTTGRGDLWRRALFMVLFTVLHGVARVVLGVVVVVQFLIVLFTGTANEQLLRLGSSLSIYTYQVFRFLTFTGDEQPFPMSAWPTDEAEDSPWYDAQA